MYVCDSDIFSNYILKFEHYSPLVVYSDLIEAVVRELYQNTLCDMEQIPAIPLFDFGRIFIISNRDFLNFCYSFSR